MRVRVYPSEAEAMAEIDAIDVAMGLPRVEVGAMIGGGRHVEAIYTRSACAPIELDGGGWGIEAARISRAGRTVGATETRSPRRREEA
jgi:hypothetical protein